MTTEKHIMLIKNIMNDDIGEEEKMILNKMKFFLENDDKVLSKNLKIGLLAFINYLLNGDGNLEEKIMNMKFDENDVNFLKGMHKSIQETKMFPPFFDLIDDDDYDFLLDMKHETLKKRLEEKYQNVLF